jgi:hypothetical protein
MLAAVLRERYDTDASPIETSHFLCEVEKPFQWADPAVPLLEEYQRSLGSVIIDSPEPFCVPHIIITAAPPENFIVAGMNATCNPQNCGRGSQLVVPPRWGVTYTNYWDPREREWVVDEDADEDIYNREEEYPTSHDEYACDGDHWDDESDMDSAPQSPLLETPVDGVAMFGSYFNMMGDGKMEYDEDAEGSVTYHSIISSERIYYSVGGDYDSDEDDEDEDEDQTKVSMFSGDSKPRQIVNYQCFADEDEDELPDLNDPWYQSIMQRSQEV